MIRTTKESVRVKKAKQEIDFDKILEIYEDMDFVEIVGKIGGDVLTFRIYNNGLVCEV